MAKNIIKMSGTSENSTTDTKPYHLNIHFLINVKEYSFKFSPEGTHNGKISRA
jgi:hypothetical protein